MTGKRAAGGDEGPLCETPRASPVYARNRADANRRALIYLGRAFSARRGRISPRIQDELIEGATMMLLALHELYGGNGPVDLRPRNKLRAQAMRAGIVDLLNGVEPNGRGTAEAE